MAILQSELVAVSGWVARPASASSIGGTYSLTSVRLPGRTWLRLESYQATTYEEAATYYCDQFVNHFRDCDGLRERAT